jgi:uncharacterized protein with HEPN domain
VTARSLIPRLADIIEAIERINVILADVSLDAFENDWQRQWLVERGIEIISEASRHLPDDLKARNPEIPWQKVAGIGNVLRHNYESIAAPVLWKLVQADLPTLEKAAAQNSSQKKVDGAADIAQRGKILLSNS